MTRKSSKTKFKQKLNMPVLQQAYLEIEDPKLLKRRAKKAQDYDLTLFVPSELVSVRPVGDKQHIYVRDAFREKNGTRYGKWRQFHNANPVVEKCQGLPYTGITAPLSAWHGVSLMFSNRIMAADLPGGREWKPKKAQQKVAA